MRCIFLLYRCNCLCVCGPVFRYSESQDADFSPPVQERPGLLPTDLPTGRGRPGPVRRHSPRPGGEHSRELRLVPVLRPLSEGSHGLEG